MIFVFIILFNPRRELFPQSEHYYSISTVILFMNQKQDSNDRYHLPRLNQSSILRPQKELIAEVTQMHRSMSQREGKNKTNKILGTEDIKNPEEYQKMTEKQLLREHDKLLKVLRKFQEVIDASLLKKQREHEKQKVPRASKQEIYRAEISNNEKIMENYASEVKELEAIKKCRKLDEVLSEKSKVADEIQAVKKEIFNLKNEDTLASRNLVTDRSLIEKELKSHEKDLKIELTKQTEYHKKIKELQEQLAHLKKQCQGILPETISLKTHLQEAEKIAAKRQEFEDVSRVHAHFEESIHENMVAKAKRNKNIARQIEQCEKRIVEINANILKYKDKIVRYQAAMEIRPK